MDLTPAQRRTLLVRRPWTDAERRVVVQGFWGRACIAVEPILGSIVFLGLAIGMGIRAARVPDSTVASICVGAIFALGFLAFVAYAVALMVGPLRALLSTTQPIFIVDGYIRCRPPDHASTDESTGYIAVLTPESNVACEWPTHGRASLESSLLPAHVEFSEYGGIHKIDGQSTGVLPEEMTTLGIGASTRR